MSTNVTFESRETEESCVNISIVDDLGVEVDQTFFVTLERTNGLDERIQVDPDAKEGEIEIYDDDSMCHVSIACIYCRIIPGFEFSFSNIYYITHLSHQWRWWVSTAQSTRSERMRVWYKYVLMSVNLRSIVPSHSPLISISTQVMTVQVRKYFIINGSPLECHLWL